MTLIIWKTSVRNILKHKNYSFINVFGLALGFTAFILIGLFVQYELNWDRSNTKYDRIYRVQRHFSKTMFAMDGNDISPHSRAITAQLLEKQFPEFERISVIHENHGKFLASVPNRQVYDDKGICADSCFFEIFTYNFLEGSQTKALNDPFTIVLSKKMADKLFLGKRALGETVTLEKKFDCKVTGVYEDLPENSYLRPEYIISFSSLAKTSGITRSDIWAGDCMTYALLKPGVDYRYIESKIKNVFSGFFGIEFEELQLCPMKNIYLSFNGRNDYIIALALFGLIGMFILMMSAINYINLTMANSFIRRKEVAIKKVSGSNRIMLVIQFLGETVIVAFLSLGLAFIIAKILLPLFAEIVGKHIGLSLINDWKFISLIILIAFIVGLFSGIYPALILSSQKIISLFKGDMVGKRHEKINMKRALVIFQFAISVFLILITLSSSLQIRHLFQMDLGFNKENILYTNMTVSKKGVEFDQFRNRILQHPEIIDGSMSKNLPFVNFGGGMINWEGGNPDEKINCRFNTVSYDFVKNMGITLITGRDFSREFAGDAGRSCLINETAAKCFGWDNPIGKRLNDNELTVVGVVKNYIFKDIHNGIEPAVLVLAPEEMAGNWIFAFRVDPRNQENAKVILTREFENVFPNDPFEFHDLPTSFGNESTFKIYHSINRTIMFFTIFNIFLAMIGLLGLVSFTVARRTKEIGVRKINGSSSLNIFYLLSREYFELLFFSILISFPTAWWIGGKIPGAYKQPAQLWVYILGAGIVFVIVLFTISYQTIRAAIRNPIEALRYE